MKEHMDWLGHEVRDRVTGFAGVVESIAFDLYGCVQTYVRAKHDPKSKEDKHGQWLDVKRLELVGKKRVMEAPRFGAPGSETGPADKAPYGNSR